MGDIICDTNIWYSLGNGLIDIETITEMPLAMHWLSLGELLVTNKSLTNPIFLKNALLAVLNRHRKLYHYPPLEHIACLYDPGKKYDTDMQKALAGLIVMLNNPLTSPELEVTYQAKLNNQVMKKTITDETNNNAQELKKLIKSKKKYLLLDNTTAVREFIVTEVNNHFKSILLDINTFDWKKLELYEGVMKLLSKMLVLGQTKLVQNDLVDIFQLIYVQPGHLFWTRDKKLKAIIKAASLNHYLFEQ